MNPRRPSEDEIFERASQLCGQQRAAYLKEVAQGDEQLGQRIEALLEAQDDAGDFLKEPAAGVSSKTFVITPNMIPVTEKPGDKIGRYNLREQIGEGGMGVVYLAEQKEPVRRRVALKIIKLGMDTKEVIARFEIERQALALMDHSNIAKVLDAGATENGRPYFVMELVRGLRITDYCDQNKLSTDERLDLFMQVCRAVQHAHQKGVIHRDLKPSNILVAVEDGVPVPKIIDFGVAKATGPSLTEKTVFTAFQQIIGTPAYMSPEQAEMGRLDIDTRTDVYALGVLLYELLTGRTPFDAEDLLRAGLDAMRRKIREEEPPRPSTRLTSLTNEELTTAAKHRKVEPHKLIHLVRGDLDWIAMKALEKERSRRYETANGLAMDVERYLSDEAVLARPTSNLYRFGKMVRRHKLAFAAAALLLFSTIFTTWQAIRATRAEGAAKSEANKKAQVAQFFKQMIEGIDPESMKGRDTTVLRELLGKSVNGIRQELKDQPEIEAELETTLANAYRLLGDNETARSLTLDRALERLYYRNTRPDQAAEWNNLIEELTRDASRTKMVNTNEQWTK